MAWKSGISFFFLLHAIGWGQNGTATELKKQGRNTDFSSFSFVGPSAVGSTLPAFCQAGQLFFNSAGANLYACTSQNTWTVLSGYTLQPASATALGGVSVPAASGLSIGTNGALSVTFGKTAGTVAAGNDSRIINALQPTSLIPAANITGLAPSAKIDTTNASNLKSGILNSKLLPGFVLQNSKVNTYINQSAPGLPALGNVSCWTDISDKNWECKNDAGTVFNAVIASSASSNQFVTGISPKGIISYAQPSFSNLIGTIGSSQLGSTVSGDLTGTLPNPAVAKVNGTSIPPNISADQAIVTTGAATGTWTSLPNCLDSLGQHLNYDTSTHTFFCGNSGSAPVSNVFSGLTSGTNTSASMFVGTGSSLAPTGSGTITANLFSGTLSASSLPPFSGDTTTTPGSNVTTTVAINGTSVPANPTADELLRTTAASAASWAAVPNCADSNGQHLNYDTSTHTFSCGATGTGQGLTGGSCPAGQYITAISSSGVPICGTPAGSVGSIFTQTGTTVGRIGTPSAPANFQISGPAPWIDVKAYGATGNGTTDDTVAIQNALNQLPASGGTVFFPCGTYLVGEGSSNVGLTISGSQFSFRLVGQAGTSWGSSKNQCVRIVTTSAITILTIGNGTTIQSGGFIEHLTFADISNSGAGGIAIGGIHLNCVSWFTLSDDEFDWFANGGLNQGYGIFEDGGSDSTQYANHNLIFRCRTDGVHYGLLIANGNHDGPDVIASQFGTSKTSSPNYGIYCAATSCANLSVTNSKVTLWDANNAGVGVYLGGIDNRLLGLVLESYKVGGTGTCCQNTGVEVAGTATRNIIGITSTRFNNALQIDQGATRLNVNYTLDTSSTNKIVNSSGNSTVTFPACANQAGTALVACP